MDVFRVEMVRIRYGLQYYGVAVKTWALLLKPPHCSQPPDSSPFWNTTVDESTPCPPETCWKSPLGTVWGGDHGVTRYSLQSPSRRGACESPIDRGTCEGPPHYPPQAELSSRTFVHDLAQLYTKSIGGYMHDPPRETRA